MIWFVNFFILIKCCIEFNLNVIIQNGQFYEAKIPIKHCPSVSGCRAIVEQNDRANKFSLTENFMITLKVRRDLF